MTVLGLVAAAKSRRADVAAAATLDVATAEHRQGNDAFCDRLGPTRPGRHRAKRRLLSPKLHFDLHSLGQQSLSEERDAESGLPNSPRAPKGAPICSKKDYIPVNLHWQ